MPAIQERQTYPRLMLRAHIAAELMTPNPVSIHENASWREALALLIDRGIRAAPVIDDAGRPVGVLSSTDLLVHDREEVDRPSTGERLDKGRRVEHADRARVRDLMTPAVFSVAPEKATDVVIDEMVALNVHRIFVVDDAGVLVGVITALDILRHLSK